MAEVVITTRQLSRDFETHRKAVGMVSALQQLFHRSVEVKQALQPLDLTIFADEMDDGFLILQEEQIWQKFLYLIVRD